MLYSPQPFKMVTKPPYFDNHCTYLRFRKDGVTCRTLLVPKKATKISVKKYDEVIIYAQGFMPYFPRGIGREQKKINISVSQDYFTCKHRIDLSDVDVFDIKSNLYNRLNDSQSNKRCEDEEIEEEDDLSEEEDDYWSEHEQDYSSDEGSSSDHSHSTTIKKESGKIEKRSDQHRPEPKTATDAIEKERDEEIEQGSDQRRPEPKIETDTTEKERVEEIGKGSDQHRPEPKTDTDKKESQRNANKRPVSNIANVVDNKKLKL